MAARRFTTPPTLEEMAEIAEEALSAIPADLLRHARSIAIRVEDFADEETLAEMGIDNPFDLTGLYTGVPLPQQSVSDPRGLPEMIYLYHQPILAEWCDTGEDLTRLVRHVLIHEIGHHFGFSDEEMDAIEAAAEEDR